MKKEFVPYEQALALKELGFYEPCFAKYFQQDDNTPFIQIGETEIEEAESSGGDVTFECDAPLYQQAFRWFREKYETYGIPISFFGGSRYVVEDKYKNYHNNLEFKTHEEAELECLKKLIEITKEKLKLKILL